METDDRPLYEIPEPTRLMFVVKEVHNGSLPLECHRNATNRTRFVSSARHSTSR
jgi:hypothetical protein